MKPTQSANLGDHVEPALLPIHPEASSYLGVRRTTIFRLAAEGQIETVQIGRKRLVPRQALDDYIARLRSSQRRGSAKAS